MGFKEKIKPFHWIEQTNSEFSLVLYVEDYSEKDELIFNTRADEGFEGNGYDWCAIAIVLIDEKLPELKNSLKFNPESDMFCVFSQDREALSMFAISFKEVCDNNTIMLDLFSRAKKNWFDKNSNGYKVLHW